MLFRSFQDGAGLVREADRESHFLPRTVADLGVLTAQARVLKRRPPMKNGTEGNGRIIKKARRGAVSGRWILPLT